MLPNTTPRINRIQQKNAVRQTVLSGPVDTAGKEDFLEIGTGLEVLSKNLSVDPLILTFGDGFTDGGQKDFTVQASDQLTWGSLPASEAEVFLYVDLLTDGSLQTGNTILEPVYSLERPSTPANGQTFYPSDHRSRMEVFNGSSWVPVLRIFVGRCSTDATNVTTVTSRVYQDKSLTQGGVLPYFAIRAFGWFNSGGTLLMEKEVSNVNHIGTGAYEVFLRRPMQTSQYVVVANSGVSASNVNTSIMVASRTRTSFRLFVNDNNGNRRNLDINFMLID